MAQALWRVSCAVADTRCAEAAVAALEPALATLSVFEAGAHYVVEGLSLEKPARGALEARLELAFLGAPPVPALTIEPMAPRDWIAETLQSFAPISVGRYYIHGSHRGEPVPAGRIPLRIDAATAFGTGEHASTRGCLMVIGALARRGRPLRVLDMGTGTGILAMAAIKTWHARVAAFDIDAQAVRVARLNARANGVRAALRPGRAGSYRARAIGRQAPFDLVLANILARPLAAMAHGLSRVLADNGVAVLSGLLPRQEEIVIAAHRRVRIHLAWRVVVDGWSTLVLTRAPRTGGLFLK
jgi:ribosomal protein L11 methyltransferase